VPSGITTNACTSAWVHDPLPDPATAARAAGINNATP